jgi:hypothetical protein
LKQQKLKITLDATFSTEYLCNRDAISRDIEEMIKMDYCHDQSKDYHWHEISESKHLIENLSIMGHSQLHFKMDDITVKIICNLYKPSVSLNLHLHQGYQFQQYLENICEYFGVPLNCYRRLINDKGCPLDTNAPIYKLNILPESVVTLECSTFDICNTSIIEEDHVTKDEQVVLYSLDQIFSKIVSKNHDDPIKRIDLV